MKNYVNEIFTRTYNMEQKLTGGTATAAVAGMQPDAAIKQFLEGIQNDVRQIRTSQLAQVIYFLSSLSSVRKDRGKLNALELGRR